MIKKILPISGRLNKTKAVKGFGGLTDADVAKADLTHEQAVEANSHAAAMLHMTKRQRNKYKKNLLKNADAAETVLLKKQLVLSDKSLDAADRQLREEMEALVAKDPSLKKNPADLATLARDNLYGQRTEAIAAKEFQLNELQKKIDNTPIHKKVHELETQRDILAAEIKHELDYEGIRTEAIAEKESDLNELQKQIDNIPIPKKVKELESQRDHLAAEIERDWGYALREGIETYASFTGLDVVVNRGQAKKMSMRDMINNPTFNREKLKEEGFDYSDRQLNGFLRDQLMMMTHHMNGFQEGGESSVDATSAVGKYAERAMLALKLKGADLSKEPYKSLSKASEALVKARKNPAELRRALEELGGGEGKADDGLRKLSGMIMEVVPGAEGLFDSGLVQDSKTPENLPIGQDLRRTRAMLASQRRLKEEQNRLSFLSGPATAALKAAEDIEWANHELEELRQEQQKRKNLGAKYLRKDWSKAEQLESELEGINQRLRVRRDLGVSSYSKELRDRRTKIEKELATLEENFKAAGGADAVEPHPDDIRLANLIKAKRQDKKRLTESLKEYMDKAAADEKAIAQDNPFSEGIISLNSYADLPADENEIEPGSEGPDIDTSTARVSPTKQKSGLEMVWVRPGEFTMGSTDEDIAEALRLGGLPAWIKHEQPAHRVRITKGFWLSKYEVTNEQYARFLNAYGSKGHELLYIGDEDAAFLCGIQAEGHKYTPKPGREQHPVVQVTWDGAKAFCDFYGLRLPTEAEWAYAARGPESLKYPWGNKWDSNKCRNMYNGGLNHFARRVATTKVGGIAADVSWCGAMDMGGNVVEMCADWYDEDYYRKSPMYDPKGPASEVHDCGRVLRGGSFYSDAESIRSASRARGAGGAHASGFRCAMSPK
jgi:formylglycine-generating enzyme required for sulfatase activity